MTGRKALYAWRLADTDKLTNAYLEATLKIDSSSGKDAHGIMFRVPSFNAANKGYLFGITCDGNYFLNKYDGTVGQYGKMTSLIDYTASSAINSGASKTNRVGVLFKDKTMTFFINGKNVVSKSTLNLGSE